MNIHGARRAGRLRRKACRLWTGGGPQRAYSGRGGAGHIVSPRAQLVSSVLNAARSSKGDDTTMVDKKTVKLRASDSPATYGALQMCFD